MPDIIQIDRSENDEFILIGCDGIWEKYGDDHVQLTKEIKESLKKDHAVNTLKTFFDKNISPTMQSGPYGKDNMTAIIIEIKKD